MVNTIEDREFDNPIIGGFATKIEEVGEPNGNKFTPALYEERALRKMLKHMRGDMTQEIGGALTGKHLQTVNGEVVYVADFVPIESVESSHDSLTWRRSDFESIATKLQINGSDLQIVGAAHSHPNAHIFPSFYDLQARFSDLPDFLMLIVNPHERTPRWAFSEYRIVNRRLLESRGFYLKSRLNSKSISSKPAV